MGVQSWLNMKSVLFLAFLVSAALASEYEQLKSFNEFKLKFSKVYNSVHEERLRFNIFQNNLAEIEAHNSGGSRYMKGINEWSDLTHEEWADLYLGGYKHISLNSNGPVSNEKFEYNVKDLPESVDWRDKGVITDIKNQGQCGSCWAFGTTEQIESYTALATGELIELSAQQVTSCTPNPLTCGGTGGCMGSTPPLGYNYVQLFGQTAESDYPYQSGTTTNTEDCLYDLSSLTPVASITGYDNLQPNSQDAVINHIATVGPLAISVAASTFKDYHGGIFDGCPYDQNIALNHAVQLVGYGSEEGVDYWIVRNSWGPNWGEDGYIRILRESEPGCGTDTTTSGHVCQGGPGNDMLHVCGMCGMLFETSFPLGAHKL